MKKTPVILAIPAAAVLVLAGGCEQTRDDIGSGRKDSMKPSASGDPMVPVGQAPMVARLVCQKEGMRSLTKRVQAQRDGIHIEIRNPADTKPFYIRSVVDPAKHHGGSLRRKGVNRIVTTMPPGRIWVACGNRAQDVPYATSAPEFAELTIVDPNGLWITPELQCDEEQAGKFVGAKAQDDAPNDAERVIRAVVPGIRADDDIVRPGYPQTPWRTEFRHVVRDGTTIASVSLFAQSGRWRVSGRRCVGADIG